VWGEKLTFSAREDVYFLTGLPFRGMVLPVDPQLLGDVHLVDLARRYCSGTNIMLGSILHIEAMENLLHECITAMIVRIHGCLVMQWISGGQLIIMQRVLDGDFFSWGFMLHTNMMGKINQCRNANFGEFSFGMILVAWFLERVPMFRPMVLFPTTEAQEP
jgi:hypothetical protein